MISLLAIAAGVLAVAAALTARTFRRTGNTIDSETALQPVSDEWLSNARGRKEEGW